MQIYEVGGAVRDALLGRQVTERDWLVVGATSDDLLKLGYRRVGKDFPVFLHPVTKEEYALARTERKVGPGYTGFTFETAPTITVEQDLARRDLTINAIARDSDGRLVDPWGGQRDIAERKLRHVSDAFREDPVRVLRTARFAAQLAAFEFSVAPETDHLMREMVASGEVDALKPERVWKETHKALSTRRPEVFFTVLRHCGALARVFPEIDDLFGVPEASERHPETDAGMHLLRALRLGATLTQDPAVSFAVLTHDLGKAATPRDLRPKHSGHEERSVELLERFCTRLPVPRAFRDLAMHVARYHCLVHRAKALQPDAVLKLLLAVDAFRKPERFEDFLLACEAAARSREGGEDALYPQAQRLRLALHAALAVDTASLLRDGKLEGAAIGAAIGEQRLTAIREALTRVD